jgi:hypothetical protein
MAQQGSNGQGSTPVSELLFGTVNNAVSGFFGYGKAQAQAKARADSARAEMTANQQQAQMIQRLVVGAAWAAAGFLLLWRVTK